MQGKPGIEVVHKRKNQERLASKKGRHRIQDGSSSFVKPSEICPKVNLS